MRRRESRREMEPLHLHESDARTIRMGPSIAHRARMRAAHALALAALVGACDLPRDPEDTLKHVENGELRVGVAIHPPWTTDSAGGFGGVEPAMVRKLAEQLHARVRWTPGGESVLMPQLHQRKLDLVIAGLDSKTPWASKAGVTRPYHWVRDPEERQLVWAVAPGENAWQMRVERFLREERDDVDALRRGAGGTSQ
jgi:polar amino acid transport system substrate-binding protein